MCIAILKPKGKIINKEILQTCATANRDGCGFAYIKDNTIYIEKYMNFEDFYTEYSKHEVDSTMLVHFRIATHGKVEVKNCHPFKLNNRMALIHNGVISGYGDKQTKSDTVDFIDKVIGNISWKMWKNPSFRTLVSDAIGYSKLAILDVTGEYFIIGEEKGYWDDGVWYSNKSYIKTFTKKEQEQTKKLTNYSYSIDEDLKIVYKCRQCGATYSLNEYETITCPTCKSYMADELGWEQDGVKYLYEDDIYKGEYQWV